MKLRLREHVAKTWQRVLRPIHHRRASKGNVSARQSYYLLHPNSPAVHEVLGEVRESFAREFATKIKILHDAESEYRFAIKARKPRAEREKLKHTVRYLRSFKLASFQRMVASRAARSAVDTVGISDAILRDNLVSFVEGSTILYCFPRYQTFSKLPKAFQEDALSGIEGTVGSKSRIFLEDFYKIYGNILRAAKNARAP